jgi:endoglucanase
LKFAANNIRDNTRVHPYGRSAGNDYQWGTNGTVARTSINVGVFDVLERDDAHLDAIALNLDHLLGRNYYGRSYVTGVGHEPPLHPHHRPSQASSSAPPWPGLLVGGPWSDQVGQLPATAWQDTSADFRTNEVAINWNAAMIYAAAALLPVRK